MRPSDKCPEEATRGRHLFPASVTIKAECRGFTRLRHRQNTAPSSPPRPLLCLTMRGVVVIFHRGFQGCGIRLLSSFPHITAAHPFVGCPASTCPASRHIADGECEEDETQSGEQRQRVNIGQRRIRRVYPAHPPPRINHYANNMLQYVTNCLVSDWCRILLKCCMNAANFAVNNSDISPGFDGSAICWGPTQQCWTYING